MYYVKIQLKFDFDQFASRTAHLPLGAMFFGHEKISKNISNCTKFFIENCRGTLFVFMHLSGKFIFFYKIW